VANREPLGHERVQRLLSLLGLPLGPTQLRFALAGLAGCLVLVALNHLLLAGALRLARGHSFRESGLFSRASLATDLGLAALGVTLVALWRWNPYLIPAALAPLALINRSFSLLTALQQSEERFRAIFESTAMGIRLTDMSGRLVAHNRSFAQMLGYEPEEFTTKPLSELTHPEDLPAKQRLFEQLVAGKRNDYQLEQRYLRADGSVLWAHLTGSLVRDADGKPQFEIGMAHDVSDRKRLEQQLQQAQKMEAVGRLAGGVAHDFNNLLTVITTHSAFALRSLDGENEALRSDVEAIERAAARAAVLTGQLLAFGRQQVLQPKVLDLNEVVVDTCKMLRRLIGGHTQVVTALGPALGRVKADPAQLEQVLVNLALNARDAMTDGGTLTLRTVNVEPGEGPVWPGGMEANTPQVMLAVSDTGCGLDEETRARMFEPFFTTKLEKGTGLGLASVYGIVAQSGGTIEVESVLGQGTTMMIYLPRVAEEIAQRPDERAETERELGGAETILLVEDEDAVRNAARRILANQGYRVLEAFDGGEALELAELHGDAIDLLLTDVVMPRLSGRELVEQLLPLWPELPVLYMSGHTDEAVFPLGVPGHATGFIQKPFTEASLTRRVRELLDAPRPEQKEHDNAGVEARWRAS